jgi:phosphoserine phosphatase
MVCDMDGTLLSVNTFPRFILFLFLDSLKRMRISNFLTLTAMLIARKRNRMSHTDFKGEVLRLSGRVHKDALDRWAGRVFRRHVDEHVLARVKSWQGTRVLSTAAPEVYASIIGEIAGFDLTLGSIMIGSTCIDNQGEHKLARLSEAGIFLIALAVTDDAIADAPLISAADRTVLITRKAPRPPDRSRRWGSPRG